MRAMTTTPLDLATIVGRSRLPQEIQKLGGMQRLDWVLSLPNPREFVETLAAEELYLLLRDIGEHDSYALLEYASGEQLHAIQDLDLWRGEEILIPRWLAWIDRCREVSLETAMRFVSATEDELLQIIMMGDVRVHTSDLELDLVPDELQLIPSPDGMFWLTAPVESDIAQRLPTLLKLMWATDQERMRAICTSSRFELLSSVEEQCRHFRNARLSELGFPAPDEAMEVFVYLDPKATKVTVMETLAAEEGPAFTPPSLGEVAQDLALAGVTPKGLLAGALELLDAEERASFGQGFTYLVNKVFMALHRDLSETDEIPDAGRRAAGLLSLGLAWLADEDVDTAAAVLRRTWPETCFRVGHSLTLELSLAARRLRHRAGTNRGLFVFGEPDDAMLQAVAGSQPMYLEGLDPGSDAVTWRPFASLQEVGVVAARLSDADAVLAFFETSLGFSPETLLTAEMNGIAEDDRRQVRLETLLRTAAAQVLLRDEMSFGALDEKDIAAVMAAALEGPRWKAALDTVLQAGAPLSPVIERFAERASDELLTALGSVAMHDLDPAFARTLFMTRTD